MAAVGSANLTSGLVADVEVVAVLRGHRGTSPLETLWAAAESWCDHEDAFDWSPERVATPAEVLEPTLFRRILATAPVGSEISTLGTDPKPNRVTEVTPDGIWVETLSSRAKGRPPQLVEAWMIQVASDYLAAHGSLTNRYLPEKDGLNVKRSSFICALLARLPGVIVASSKPITLA